MDAPQAYPLRALGIGEIFDRAVTMYVRNFVVFTLMMLTLLVPIAVLQIVTMPDQTQTINAVLAQIQHPTKDAVAPIGNAQFGVIVLIGLITILLLPFINNAVAVGVASAYSGKRPAYGASFARVLRRWLPLLATTLLFLLIVFGIYFVAVFALGILIGIGIALVAPLLPLALVVFGLALVAALAVLLFFLTLLIAYAFATYSTTLEDLRPSEAIGSAFRRVFNRKELGKALLVALAYLAIQMGVVTLSASAALLIMLVIKNDTLQVLVSTVISAMFTAFLTILLAVYYYDVRTRAEGLDLEVDLERLTIAPAS